MAHACDQAIQPSDSVAFTPSKRDGREGFFCALIPGGQHFWTVSAPESRRNADGE